MFAQIQRALRRRRYQAAPTDDTEPKSPTSPIGNDKKVEGFHFYSARNDGKRENGLVKPSNKNEQYLSLEISTEKDSS